MKKSKKNLRFNQFWLNPLLIGSMIGLGYSLTKELAIKNHFPRSEIIQLVEAISKSNEKSDLKENADIKQKVNAEKNNERETNFLKSSNPLKAGGGGQTVELTDRQEETKFTIPSTTSRRKGLETSDALKKKTFFEKYDNDELFKSLPD